MSANITIVGNLTREPELRFTKSGDAVVNLSVAVNERVKQGDDWVDGEPSYYDLKVWRKLAENVAENLNKGDRIVAVGKMKIEKFEDKEGNQRSKPVMTVDEIGESVRFKGSSRKPAAEPADDIPPF